MAEVKANIGANVTGFQRGIHDAIEGLNHFREHAKDVGKEVTNAIGGKDLSKMLGMAGVTAAVAAFGVALVEAAKKGIEAFSEFEQLTLRIKYNLANPDLAKPIMENLEKSSGAAGSLAERATAYQTLLSANIQPGEEDSKEEAKEDEPKTQEMEVGGKKITVEVVPAQGHQTGPEIGAGKILAALDQWAAKNSESQSQMADTLRIIHAGGADAGEGMNRAIKSFKGLDQALAPNLAAYQAKQQPEQAAEHLEALEKEKEYRAKHKFGKIGGFETQTELNEYTKLHKETTAKAPVATTADMIKAKAVDWPTIIKAIVEGAPKGAVEEEKGTLEGHEKELAARFDELEKAIGAALAPDLEMLMSEITTALPGLTAAIIPVATEIMADVIPALEAFTAAVGQATKAESDALAKAGKSEMEHWEDLHKSGQMDDEGNIRASAYKGQAGGTMGDLMTDQWQMTVFKGLGMKLPDFGAQGVAEARLADTGKDPSKLDEHHPLIQKVDTTNDLLQRQNTILGDAFGQ